MDKKLLTHLALLGAERRAIELEKELTMLRSFLSSVAKTGKKASVRSTKTSLHWSKLPGNEIRRDKWLKAMRKAKKR